MTNSKKGIQLSMPGFGSAQAAYQGPMDPDQVARLYQKEMPAVDGSQVEGLLSEGEYADV